MYEYLRALHYELAVLPRFDRIQLCSAENARYLLSFAPRLAPALDTSSRAGIDVQSYDFTTAGREPFTLLFLGSFRHAPNIRGFEWFTSHVLPRVTGARPGLRVIAVGSGMPAHLLSAQRPNVEIQGYVPDVREPLSRYAVFVCPVLSGSGMRVKLLEAFAAGIPVVSTPIGAEGFSTKDGEFCRLAEKPADFARAVLELFDNPREGAEMAARARALVERERDSRRMRELLAATYRATLEGKRAPIVSAPARP
jgi:glycosyltransferase involved in cell wall biosynthesis